MCTGQTAKMIAVNAGAGAAGAGVGVGIGKGVEAALPESTLEPGGSNKRRSKSPKKIPPDWERTPPPDGDTFQEKYNNYLRQNGESMRSKGHPGPYPDDGLRKADAAAMAELEAMQAQKKPKKGGNGLGIE